MTSLLFSAAMFLSGQTSTCTTCNFYQDSLPPSVITNPLASNLDMNGNSLICDDDQDSSLVCSTDDTMQLSTGGSARLTLTNTSLACAVDVDLQGNDVILDDDGDTSIVASTDDTLQLSTGGSVRATLTDTALTTAVPVDVDGNATGIVLDADADTNCFASTDDTLQCNTGGTLRLTLDEDLTLGTSGEYRFASGTRMISSSDGTLSVQENDASTFFTISPANATIVAGADLTISTGFGSDLTLRSGSGANDIIANANSLRLPIQEADSVSEPVTCDASHTGYTQYVDDTNDSASAAVCICVATDDSTYDWALDGSRVASIWTACPFY